MDTLDVVGKIVFSLTACYYAYDLFYRDIYLKKTKGFFIPAAGGLGPGIKNDFIRRLLKFIMMLIFIWWTINTP